jgi:hypothetical protein
LIGYSIVLLAPIVSATHISRPRSDPSFRRAIKKIIEASQRMINEQNNKSKKIVEMLTNNKKKKYDVREYFGTEEEWKEDTDEGGKDEDGNKNFERVGHCALKQLAYCDEHEIL